MRLLEAADTLLGISLYGTDPNTTIRWVVVNEIRSKTLKTKKEIEQLDENSENIFCPNFVDDYYANRPTELKNLCLYDFAKWNDRVNYKLKNEDAECYQIGSNRYVRKRKQEYLISFFLCYLVSLSYTCHNFLVVSNWHTDFVCPSREYSAYCIYGCVGG